MIGVITATAEEIAALRKVLKNPQLVSAQAGMEFITGTLGGQEAACVKAGIGKVNAAVCTQVLIDRFQPEAIINVGVAGALNPELRVGDIVISRDAAQHDFDTTFFGDEPGFISGLNQVYFSASEKLAEAALQAASELGFISRLGRIVTGDQFIAEPARKQWMIRQFQGDCTEMEGAAIAQACALNQVPFVIIRAISDGAGDEAPMQYEEFVNLAAERAMKLIVKTLQKVEEERI